MFFVSDNEAEMIDKVASDVTAVLGFTPSKDFDDFVGVGAEITAIKSKLILQLEQVKMIALVGPAGIGKTTTATVLYNQLYPNFQFSTFLENIRGSYEKPCGNDYNLKLSLQKNLLAEILNQKDIEVRHLGVAQQRLSDKKVLVVLDEVDSWWQLEATAYQRGWFGPGSIIIITTEDRKLLKTLRLGIDHIYKMKFPTRDESFQIFCQYAFDQKSPDYGFEELAQKITWLAGDLPLGLKVMGSYLRGMSRDEWIEALPRLRSSLDREIESTLRFSYDGLSDKDQALFLHIACFFGTGKVLGIFLRWGKNLQVSKSAFDGMNNLQFLKVQYSSNVVHIPEGLNCLPNKLRLIHWDYCPLRFWPSKFSAKFLVELIMYDSNFEKLWEGIQPLQCLKLMDLSCSKYLKEIPDLSKATSLEVLELPYCESLLELTSSIGNATKLNPSNTAIEELPSSISTWSCLYKLNMRGCENLKEFPNVPESIVELWLDWTGIEEIPPWIEKLFRLRILSMSYCGLKKISPNISKLENLEWLHLCRNCGVENYVHVVHDQAIIEWGPELKRRWRLETDFDFDYILPICLPEKALTSPISLSFGNERSRTILPDCIRRLSQLTELDITECGELVALPPLPGSLLSINAHGCGSLESIDSSSFQNPNICLDFAKCFNLNQEARRLIQTSACKYALLPGEEVPAHFTHQANSGSLTVNMAQTHLPSSFRFKACILLTNDDDDEEGENSLRGGISCRVSGKQNGHTVQYGSNQVHHMPYLSGQAEHLYIFEDSVSLNQDCPEAEEATFNELFFKFRVHDEGWKVKGCGVRLLEEPEILRFKIFEPVLLLGKHRFAGVDMRIRVNGGGHTSQDVAGIAGYHSSNSDNEAQMIDKVASDVTAVLCFAPSKDFDDFVGIRARITEIKSKLILQSEQVKMIVLVGPAGIGKTTTATVLYNQLSPNFQFSTFLENIRGNYEKPCGNDYQLKLSLQKKLLAEILNQKDIEVRHLGVAQQRLSDKKVLVVLDEVDSWWQLEATAYQRGWVGPGSIIIITTEDRKLLRTFRPGNDHIYEMKFPTENESLQILCQFAFGQNSPYDGFKELAREVTRLAGDLPLGLKVMGSYLRGMSRDEWIEALPRLRSSLDREIESTLRFSYDGLSDKDQALFLHIACFFSCSLWNGTGKVLGIYLTWGRSLQISKGAFDGMNNLRFLNVYYGPLCMPEGLNCFPDKLRFIRWPCCALRFWPSKFSFKFLVELHMYDSKFEKLWEGIQPLPCLKLMDLTSSRYLKEIPDLSKATSLERLDLCHCESLLELTSSIGSAAELELYMGHTAIEELPSSISTWSCLYKLSIEGCKNIKDFPNVPDSIVELNLSKTGIEEVPPWIEKLFRLRKLSMFGCEKLKTISPNISKLENLEFLALSNFYRWDEDPEYCDFINYNEAIIEWGSEMKRRWSLETDFDFDYILPICLPEKALTSPISLRFGHEGFETIPNCIRRLSGLIKLDITECSRLVALPPLPGSLLSINAQGCAYLESIDSSSFQNPNICLNFAKCFNLNHEARRLIQTSACKYALLPGEEVPAHFTHQANSGSLTINMAQTHLPSSFRFKACILLTKGNTDLADHNDEDKNSFTGISCRIGGKQNGHTVPYGSDQLHRMPVPYLLQEHLYIFEDSFSLNQDCPEAEEATFNELFFKFRVHDEGWKVKGCGVRLLEEVPQCILDGKETEDEECIVLSLSSTIILRVEVEERVVVDLRRASVCRGLLAIRFLVVTFRLASDLLWGASGIEWKTVLLDPACLSLNLRAVGTLVDSMASFSPSICSGITSPSILSSFTWRRPDSKLGGILSIGSERRARADRLSLEPECEASLLPFGLSIRDCKLRAGVISCLEAEG
ncbi:hypothetical protein F2Q70_00014467 [Brassica cretica]|uniref:ADP-ribosyl cyclase/cyclic ADP-ribose hydrolase n=1 Tax=Brassica cretica TaxID=69181 RepID=A0A8S9I1W5_BRACR|nr:hypothetical protein F2Q70_00014467 [Brassica cretica]